MVRSNALLQIAVTCFQRPAHRLGAVAVGEPLRRSLTRLVARWRFLHQPGERQFQRCHGVRHGKIHLRPPSLLSPDSPNGKGGSPLAQTNKNLCCRMSVVSEASTCVRAVKKDGLASLIYRFFFCGCFRPTGSCLQSLTELLREYFAFCDASVSSKLHVYLVNLFRRGFVFG